VGWPYGHDGVLTISPPIAPGQPLGLFDQAVALMDLAAQAGLPVPRYEAVVPLASGAVAVLQHRVIGEAAGEVTMGLVDRLIEFADIRRGLLAGTAFAQRPMPLYLRSDGPGFCLHGTLREFDTRTVAVIAAIEATIDSPEDDFLVGNDIVHFDYHVGNILVDPTRPDRVTGIVDWGGAQPGLLEFDLAMLAFDLNWRSTSDLEQSRTTPGGAASRMIGWAVATVRGDRGCVRAGRAAVTRSRS
jgi:hypothetical protein